LVIKSKKYFVKTAKRENILKKMKYMF